MRWYNKIWKRNKRLGVDAKTFVRSFEAAKQKNNLTNWLNDDFETYNAKLWQGLDALRARSRNADNNTPLCTGFIKQTARGVVGNGFQLRPNTGNKELDDAVHKLWKKQSMPKNFTTQGNISRLDFEYLCMYQLIRDGEVFIQKVRNYQKNDTGYSLRLIDASQISTQYFGGGNYSAQALGARPLTQTPIDANTGNRIVLGIQVDSDYRPVAYHLRTGKHRNDISSTFTYYSSEIDVIPAEDMIHIFVPQYPNQTRGVPWTHSALEHLETLDRFNSVAMNAARLGAAKAMTIESGDGGSYSGDETSGDSFEIDMSGEDVSHLPKGTKLVFHDPKYPHELYDEFVNRTQQILANALDTNYAIMFGNYKDLNYSAGQLAIADQREKYKVFQRIVSERLYGAFYGEFIEHCIVRRKMAYSNGDLVLPSPELVRICCDNYEFKGKNFAPVDLAKSAMANKSAIETGTKSRSEIIRENGGIPEEVFAEILAERELLGDMKTTGDGKNLEDEDDKKPDDDDDPDKENNKK